MSETPTLTTEDETSEESLDGSGTEVEPAEEEKTDDKEMPFDPSEIADDEPSNESLDSSESEVEPAEEEKTEDEEELEDELVELSENESDLFDGIDDEPAEPAEPEKTEEKPSKKTDSEAIGEAVTEGLGALCTVGLEEDERKEYEDQFADVFKKFKVGHFAERTWEEKIQTGDTEIDPVWGLIASTAVAGLLCYAQRPDSDEKIEQLKAKILNNKEEGEQ